MTNINASGMHFKDLNEKIKAAKGDVTVENCIGQRYVGSGLSNARVIIKGTPGNALASYLDGAEIVVCGNAQDAVGDTMNAGKVVIEGNVGDALGYAMRGGKIFVKGNAGYRTGIHMKEYKDKKPVIVVGGKCGSFLGEYLAGGMIIVLGLEEREKIVGNFTGTGMHGGKIYIRTDEPDCVLPEQVSASLATGEDKAEIKEVLEEYAETFNLNADELYQSNYYVLKPNAKNPYKRLYTHN